MNSRILRLGIDISVEEFSAFVLKSEDYKEIEDMQEPSEEQAEMVKKRWDEWLHGKQLKSKEDVDMTKIWLKVYIKSKKVHPQLFI